MRRPFLLGASGRAQHLELEVLYAPARGNGLPIGKGVADDCESEAGRGQSAGLTNRNGEHAGIAGVTEKAAGVGARQLRRGGAGVCGGGRAALVSARPAVFDPRSPRDQPPRLPGDDFDVPFEEAIAWARERRAVLPAEFYGARLQAVRARAFTVSGLAALDQLQQVADSMAEATAAGQTLREWQRSLPPDVFTLGKARRELIFRNALQTHYGIGRTIQQRENAAARGFLMWDAINDSRTRPAHRAMDGHIAPIDDPIWKKWHPPAGHQCRCSRIALTEAQARARGWPKAGPNVEPDAGWEGDPSDGNEDLVRIVRARRTQCAVGFGAAEFAFKRRDQPQWCFGPGEALARRLDYAVRVGKRSLIDPLAMEYRVLAFIEQAERSGGQGSAMVVGDFTRQRDLFDLIGAPALAINRVSIQPSYLLHIKHEHGPGGVKADRGLVLPEHIAAMAASINSGEFEPYAGAQSHASWPLVTMIVSIAGQRFRLVFEARGGKRSRSLALYGIFPVKK